MERRPITHLLATPKRINSRPPTTHLVDNVNAGRTLCGRLIDPATWLYHGQAAAHPTCAACQNIARKRRPSLEAVPSGRLTLGAK